MGKFLIGFALGMGLGIGLTLLLTPEPGHVNREKLRAKTDRFAGGEGSPLGDLGNKISAQRSRLEEAIEVGRSASAEQQKALWNQLNLTPPSPESGSEGQPLPPARIG
ncbi:MAG: hypothetical protein H0T73_23230 [Ardenticatenales bacterium]|nr:hypothetical protein [Ardenticatenales bacterium]